MNYKDKWNAMSKFSRTLYIVAIVIAVNILVITILGFTNVMDLEKINMVTMPIVATLFAIKGVYDYKVNKGFVYMNSAVSGMFIITTIFAYVRYFGI